MGMGRRLGIAAAAFCCIALVLLAGPGDRADAATVACGDTITEDTVLAADLSCTGTALHIGADRVDLDLAGHIVESICDEADCSASIGIDNEGFDRTRISDGTVRGVQSAIRLTGADRNELAGLVAVGGGRFRYGSNAVTLLRSDRNTIVGSELLGGDPGLLISASDRNHVTGTSISSGVDIRVGDGVRIEEGSSRNTLRNSEIDGLVAGLVVLDSDDNLLASSSVSAFADAVLLQRGDRNRIAGNELDSGQAYAVEAMGVSRSEIVDNDGGPLTISGNRNLVGRNSATANAFVEVALTIAGGDRNVVRANQTRFGFLNAEILVRAAATADSPGEQHGDRVAQRSLVHRRGRHPGRGAGDDHPAKRRHRQLRPRDRCGLRRGRRRRQPRERERQPAAVRERRLHALNQPSRFKVV